ncbi:hypothetical protein GGS21DRAFT_511423 [Xylaria nigripes]|nr:hypothetical protein GGS21DRAFT_511423 [Xylaria nigripes]
MESSDKIGPVERIVVGVDRAVTPAPNPSTDLERLHRDFYLALLAWSDQLQNLATSQARSMSHQRETQEELRVLNMAVCEMEKTIMRDPVTSDFLRRRRGPDANHPDPQVNADWQNGSDPAGTSNSARAPISQNNTSPVALNRRDLQTLLRHIDFSDVSHLLALCRVDSRQLARDLHLFCDSMTFSPMDIDYVVVGGPSAKYIEDGVVKRTTVPDFPLRPGGPSLVDLKGLHVLDLAYKVRRGADLSMIPQWLINCLPHCVYDLGQLCLHRRYARRENTRQIIPTRFNVVVDALNPQKPVWIVLRPEFQRQLPSRQVLAMSDNSLEPFQVHGPRGLIFTSMALLAERIADLDLTGDAPDYGSDPNFRRAMDLVRLLTVRDVLRVEFSVPDFGAADGGQGGSE